MRSLGLRRSLAAIVVMAAGCGSDPATTTTRKPVPPGSGAASGLDGPVLRHLAAPGTDGEAAEVRGVIEVEGACLYVSLDEVGERYPVVWPAATTWDPNVERLMLPNGDAVGHGDPVFGGGGHRSVDDVAAVAGEEAARRAQQCVDNRYGEIAVVNNFADAIAAGHRAAGDEPSGEPIEELPVASDWVVTDLTVDGTRVELDPSVPITASIESGTISRVGACNQYAGSIDWSEEAGFGRFVVSDLSWTEMGCVEEVMELKQSFLAALQAVDSFERADGLFVSEAGRPTGFRLVPAGSGG